MTFGCGSSPCINRHQDVSWLEVAVDHTFLVRVLDRVADLGKEFQPRLGIQFVPIAIRVDRLTLDELHGKVGAPFGRGAGFVDPRDAGVIHHRQGLALCLEARDHGSWYPCLA